MWSVSLLLILGAAGQLASGRPTCDATSGVCAGDGQHLSVIVKKPSNSDPAQSSIEPQCLYEPIDLRSCPGDDSEAFFSAESMQPAQSATPEERSKVSRSQLLSDQLIL